jgi:hypothetical protein
VTFVKKVSYFYCNSICSKLNVDYHFCIICEHMDFFVVIVRDFYKNS